MFTGIITDVGRVLEIADGGGRRMTIGTRLPLAEIPLGSSIATSGICFSAVEKGTDWFTVEASDATLEVTTAGAWAVGDSVNLERSLRIGDDMGGHEEVPAQLHCVGLHDDLTQSGLRSIHRPA